MATSISELQTNELNLKASLNVATVPTALEGFAVPAGSRTNVSVTIYKMPYSSSQLRNLGSNLGKDDVNNIVKNIATDTKLKVSANPTTGGYYRIIEPDKYAGMWIRTADFSKSVPVYYSPPASNNPGTKSSAASVGTPKNASTSTSSGNTANTKTEETVTEEPSQYDPYLEMAPRITTEDGNYDASLDEAIRGYRNSFGSPFLYSNDTDPCYYGSDGKFYKEGEGGVGHTMMSTIYSTPAVFSICPGKVKYLPNLLDKGSSIFESLKDLFKGVNVAEEIVGESSESGAFARQLYEFTPDYNDYINRLNVMARVSAIFMGIGDKTCPWQGVPYREADYSYYTTGKRGTREKPKDVLGNFLWQLNMGLDDLDSTDMQYIHFFLTADGSSVDQNFTTTASGIGLFDELQGEGSVQQKVKEMSFLFNGAMSSSESMSAIAGDLDQLASNIGASNETVGSLINMVKGWAQGGKMIIPDMLDNASYESSVSCHLTFRSLYGDPESIFLNVNLPCLALLCFVLPKQLAENMYSYPYICRCYQRGAYNSDLCFISNLNFRRGGDSETSWTESGLATEVEATFTITPLYSALSGGNGRNPFLFMSNTSLIEYLGNMCGLDLKVDQVKLKLELAKNLLGTYFKSDELGDVQGRKLAEWARAKLDGLFSFK